MRRLVNVITMHSSNPKVIASTSMDYWRLNDFRLVPWNIQKLKWDGFVHDQLIHREIVAIREEIINAAIANMIQKYCLEKKLFEFGSQCVQLAWLRSFDWMYLRIDPYWKCNWSGKPTYLTVDSEPQFGPPDIWMSGNVSRIFVQKSASLRSLFPGTAASKSRFNDQKKCNALQKQRTKFKISKAAETEQTDKRKKKVATPIAAAISMVTTMVTKSTSVPKILSTSTKSFQMDWQAKDGPSSSVHHEYTRNV